MTFELQELAALVGGGTTIMTMKGLPTEDEIAALERTLGVTFPNDYKQFLLAVGALIIQVDNDVWPHASMGSIGPHWMQTRYELDIYGLCAEPEWLRIDVNTEGFRRSTELPLVPVFMWIHSRDCIAFDADGKLVEYTDGETTPLEESFTDVLHRLIAEQIEFKEELHKR